MKTVYLSLLFCCSAFITSHAQIPKPDKIKTPEGTLTVQPITHGSLVLSFNGKTIYVDPMAVRPDIKDCPPPILS